MPLLAHIDDDSELLEGVEAICQDLSLAMQVCEAKLKELADSDAGLPSLSERVEVLSTELRSHALDEMYDSVASLMASSFSDVSSICFLHDFAGTSESDEALLIKAASEDEFVLQLEGLQSKQMPRLVLLDLKLDASGPQSGLNALSKIRQNEILGSVPIIMFTQHFDETTVQMSFARGASSYVLKGGTRFEENLVRVLSTWLILSRLPSEVPVESFVSD